MKFPPWEFIHNWIRARNVQKLMEADSSEYSSWKEKHKTKVVTDAIQMLRKSQRALLDTEIVSSLSKEYSYFRADSAISDILNVSVVEATCIVKYVQNDEIYFSESIPRLIVESVSLIDKEKLNRIKHWDFYFVNKDQIDVLLDHIRTITHNVDRILQSSELAMTENEIFEVYPEKDAISHEILQATSTWMSFHLPMRHKVTYMTLENMFNELLGIWFGNLSENTRKRISFDNLEQFFGIWKKPFKRRAKIILDNIRPIITEEAEIMVEFIRTADTDTLDFIDQTIQRRRKKLKK
jgi:hypothetical protein